MIAQIITLEPGTQIAYLPMHANGDINHPDVEFGFVVTARNREWALCRYWEKGKLGTLRTVSNSEMTRRDQIIEYASVPDEVVTKIMTELGYINNPGNAGSPGRKAK